jgi:hypothetical protein
MFDPNAEPQKKNPNLKVVPDSVEPEKKPKSGLHLLLLLILIGGVFGAYWIDSWKDKSPIVVHPDGSATLHPERDAELQKALDEINNAEQYALRATADGYFPCYSCPNGETTLFLYVGQVWRYGSTKLGVKGRYPDGNYGADNLIYVIEFMGNIAECEAMEKTKIFNYPLLPEARKRSFTLPRPPGNKIDR